MTPAPSHRIQLVVFDWAGTTVDHGCCAPVAAFIETFARSGIDVSVGQARGPMGLGKKDHIRALAQTPAISRQWQKVHGRPWNEADIDALFERFQPLQLEVVRRSSRLIDGLPESVVWLRRRGIRIATSTGYFPEAARVVYEAAAEQGYQPDHNLCAGDVPAGRPAPWMIFRSMEALNVYPPQAVIKIGDTVPDVQEGLNAGTWSVGVSHTGNDVGVDAEQFARLPDDERELLVARAEARLTEAGAHELIASVADVPAVVTRIEQRLAAGQKP